MIVDMQGNPVEPKPDWVIKFIFPAEEYEEENIKDIAVNLSGMLNQSGLKHQGKYGTTEDEKSGSL